MESMTLESARSAQEDQDLQRAVLAYRFFYPAVSMEGMVEGGREMGVPDGEALLLLAAEPQHLIFTANSDTPYGSGTLDLRDTGPLVIDLPPGPYIGLVNDHHQRWIVDVGIPGKDAGNGGKYLVLPPDFRGEPPPGYEVARAQTFKILIAIRAMPVDGFPKAFAALRAVKVHPLRDPSGAIPFVDVTEQELDTTPLRWEDNLQFWQRLHDVVEEEPVLEEFRPMYGLLAALGIEKGRPFAPDERRRALLETAARAALAQMRVAAFASQRPDRLVWKDRRWEWVGLVPDSPNFETESYLDLEARDRWFVQAVVSSPAMFRRKVGVGSVYFLAARDRDGAFLDGGRNYRLKVPQPVPAKLFWSVTAYDAKTRSEVWTDQRKAALRSMLEHFVVGADGQVELFFGPDAPAGKEGQWIETAPDTGFFTYFRIYGPEAASLDGSWKAGDFEPLG